MWQKINEFQFINETDGKVIVSAGPLLNGGRYAEYGEIGGRQEDSTHRSQIIDDVIFYYRWKGTK